MDCGEHREVAGVSEPLIGGTPVNRSPISLVHSWEVRCRAHTPSVYGPWHRSPRPSARGPFIYNHYREHSPKFPHLAPSHDLR